VTTTNDDQTLPPLLPLSPYEHPHDCIHTHTHPCTPHTSSRAGWGGLEHRHEGVQGRKEIHRPPTLHSLENLRSTPSIHHSQPPQTPHPLTVIPLTSDSTHQYHTTQHKSQVHHSHTQSYILKPLSLPSSFKSYIRFHHLLHPSLISPFLTTAVSGVRPHSVLVAYTLLLVGDNRYLHCSRM